MQHLFKLMLYCIHEIVNLCYKQLNHCRMCEMKCKTHDSYKRMETHLAEAWWDIA